MTSRRPTYRWTGVGLGFLVLVGLGTVLQSPTVLATSAVPLVYVAYTYLTSPPTLPLDITREFDDTAPVPGDEVRVTLHVTNTGTTTVPDLRLIDGVPGELGVVDGSPRLGAALAPGQTASTEYTVVARQGRHTFDDPDVVAYNSSGATLIEGSLDETTVLHCDVPIEEVPLGEKTARNVGRLTADTGGPGTEFHSLREYRPGDPQSRVDWREFARTGELTTINFREERAATVQLLVDDTDAARALVDPKRPSAVEYCVYAAELTFRALLAEGHRAGIGFHPTNPAALRVGAGEQQHVRARNLFASRMVDADAAGQLDQQGEATATDGGIIGGRNSSVTRTVKRLAESLPGHAQIVLVSPLYDDTMIELVRRLQAREYELSVIAPNPVRSPDDLSPQRRLEQIQRQLRILTLLGRDVSVVDWNVDDPLQLVIERALTEVSG